MQYFLTAFQTPVKIKMSLTYNCASKQDKTLKFFCEVANCIHYTTKTAKGANTPFAVH